MMSTANLMAVNIKQIDAPSVSLDREEIEGISFAQSFDDGVKATVTSSDRSLSGEVHSLVSQARPVVSQALAENASVPKRSKEKDTAAWTPSIQKNIESQTAREMASSAASPEGTGSAIAVAKANKIEDEASRLDTGDSPGKSLQTTADEPAGDVSSESIVNRGAGVVAVSRASIPIASDGTVQKKERAATDKSEATTSAKKTEKTQQHIATPEILHKTVERSLNSGGDTANAAPIATGQTGARAAGLSDGGLQDKTDKASASGNGEVISTISHGSTGGALSVLVARVGTETAANAKDAVTETATAPASEQSASTKPDTEVISTAGSSLLPFTDIGSRTQTATDAIPQILHAMVGGVGAVAAVPPSPAHAGEIGGQKQFSGESSSTHGTVGSEETNGFGEAGATLEGSPRMFLATPTTLEVGIQNGSHGWLKVRAEIVDGGAVNASVSAASSAGQEMLHRELPALTAYLQQEKVAVTAVVVHAPLQAGSEYRGSSAAMGGGQAEQRSNEGGGQRQQDAAKTTTSHRIGEATSYEGLDRGGEGELQPNIAYSGGGSWLSVRA